MKKTTFFKWILTVFLLLLSGFIGALGSSYLVYAIKGQLYTLLQPNVFLQSITTDRRHLLMFCILSLVVFALACYYCYFKTSLKKQTTDMQRLTPEIEIPIASGQKQYGSARFLNEKEQTRLFQSVTVSQDQSLIRNLMEEGKADQGTVKTGEIRESISLADNAVTNGFKAGIPVAYRLLPSGRSEDIKIAGGDIHTLCFGATRSGKTRTLVLQSIVLQALAGVDMINSDPKGELYQYTYPFLKRLGYTDFPLDFKNPKRSDHYNFLEFVIQALEQNDLSKAISCSWDFVDSIVKESKNADPLWANGEKGLLAAAVMQVVYDNSKSGLALQYPYATEDERNRLYETTHRWYQNCTNLFQYIAEMTEPNPATGNLLLSDIIWALPDNHPAKLTLKIARSAPPKTRGSFITSALATLRLFIDPNIAEMTCYTEDGFTDTHLKKAIFIILPDSKETYYPLASMFVNQYYQYLADEADEKGGRLDRDCELNLDEFGNFTRIPAFDVKLTVAAGRGIHFHLYLQSKEQLITKYDKETAGIILDNCHYWIYLKSGGSETLKMIEEKLGRYTVLSISSSASMNSNGALSTNLAGTSSSSSTQLMARSLLTTDEIEKIARPYLLVMVDGYPSLTQCPDLHKWSFNQMLGLGTPAHNTKIRLLRESARPQHMVGDLKLWDFMPYINLLFARKTDQLQEKEPDEDIVAQIQENLADIF